MSDTDAKIRALFSKLSYEASNKFPPPFVNPRMLVLFDTRNEDTATSALENGKRFAASLLDETRGTS